MMGKAKGIEEKVGILASSNSSSLDLAFLNLTLLHIIAVLYLCIALSFFFIKKSFFLYRHTGYGRPIQKSFLGI